MTREELAQRPDLIEAGKQNELPHGILKAKRPNVAAAIEAVPEREWYSKIGWVPDSGSIVDSYANRIARKVERPAEDGEFDLWEVREYAGQMYVHRPDGHRQYRLDTLIVDTRFTGRWMYADGLLRDMPCRVVKNHGSAICTTLGAMRGTTQEWATHAVMRRKRPQEGQ